MAIVNWKGLITQAVSVKQLIAQNDKSKAFPWHLPRVAATEEVVAQIENDLGFGLPDDYKQFLLHANGWPCFYIVTDLFGGPEFAARRHQQCLRDRPELIQHIEQAVQGLPYGVVGSSEHDLDVFVLVSTGRVVWFANEEVDSFESFADFFASMIEYNKLVLSELTKGM